MKRVFQTTISMMLVVVLLALSGLAIAGWSHNGVTSNPQAGAVQGGTGSSQQSSQLVAGSDKPKPI